MLPDLTQSVAEIATFLANEIFKTNPDMETMREYAQQIVLAGFRTKALLVANVKVEDVSGWRWMRMFHMDLFEQWINDNRFEGSFAVVGTRDCMFVTNQLKYNAKDSNIKQ
jgi:hypothetical protein